MDDDDELLLAKRLVDARKAEDILLPPDDDAEATAELRPAFDEMFAVGLLLDDELLRSRPNPERLPRNCGVTNETKFSAAVTPVKRIVASIAPVVTLAVRTVATAVFACCAAWRGARRQ